MQWCERTPDGSTFPTKLPQSITHERTLVNSEGKLKAFLSAMNSLGPKLGPLLIQPLDFNDAKLSGLGREWAQRLGMKGDSGRREDTRGE